MHKIIMSPHSPLKSIAERTECLTFSQLRKPDMDTKQMHTDRAGHKMKQTRFRLNSRKHCEGDEALQRVAGGVVETPPRWSSKVARMWSWATSLVRVLDQMASRGPFKPKPCNSMTGKVFIFHYKQILIWWFLLQPAQSVLPQKLSCTSAVI